MVGRASWHSEHPVACTCVRCTEKRSIKSERGKVGRNEKCPCGSGKKYKRCHGN